MEPAAEVVPYELVVSERKSSHDEPSIAVYRSVDAWRDHWESLHRGSLPSHACPEPGLRGRMLIEVAAGRTSTGSARLEVTSVERTASGLEVLAALHYPTSGQASRRDIGSPFVVLMTSAFDGYVYLDLSVLHGIRRRATCW
jgi:hypothetical protein